MERLDQHMARTAAQMLPPSDSENAGELRTRFRHLPVQLHTSGLAATYAFIAARAHSGDNDSLKRAYTDVARLIRKRLSDSDLLPDMRDVTGPDVHRTVLNELGKMEFTEYARATSEVEMLFTWLRRLAEALYPKERT